MIADKTSLSKASILYYFDSKEAIHSQLIKKLLEKWLEPLHTIESSGNPIEESCGYVRRKLEMARDFPKESRLFANEILQGAPHFLTELTGPLRELTDNKAEVILQWSKTGKIAKLNPHHLIFSIWATTQHYADFDVQVKAVLDSNSNDHFEQAFEFLDNMYRATLSPN